MDNFEKISEKVRGWYEKYTEGSWDTKQPQFWILFWGGAILGCIIYYILTFQIRDSLTKPIPKIVGNIIIAVCCFLPLFFLRRLHPVVLILVIYFLFKWF